MDDELVGARVLADWCKCSDRNIRELAERGILTRQGRGKYPLKKSVQAYMEHLRSMAASGSGSSEDDTNLTLERALLAREQREGVRLKNEEARGELLRKDDVLSEWAKILRVLSARVRAIPSRVRQELPHLTADEVAAIDREVRDALTQVARDEVADD